MADVSKLVTLPSGDQYNIKDAVAQSSLDGKVDKVQGKGLSTNDYTDAEKQKLAGIESGANNTVVDTSISDVSSNPVQNRVIKAALDTKADSADTYTKAEVDASLSLIEVTVDASLSSSSTHPVQNKVVKAALDTKADADSVYTKAESDSLLDDKVDASNVYSKVEVDSALSLKANAANVYSRSNLYTKNEVDNILAEKVDISAVYTKSEIDTSLAEKANISDVYTKGQVDSALENVEIAVDSVISSTSTRPVQNRAIKEALDLKADLSAVYTKANVDNALSQKADVSDLYTRSEIDTLLGNVPAALNVYTRNEIDASLAGKADADAVYTKGYVYTKEEVDNALLSKADFVDVCSRSYVYSKSEVNSMISGKANASDVYRKDEVYSKAELPRYVYSKSEMNTALEAKANQADVYSKDELYTKDELYSKQEIDDALRRQFELTFEEVPTLGSNLVITSGGVFNALSNLQSRIWGTNISLSTHRWVENNGIYSQDVEIAGMTKYSMVELKPTLQQIAMFKRDGVDIFFADNDNGVLTVYSIGGVPTESLTIQCVITEVGNSPASITAAPTTFVIDENSTDAEYPSAKAIWDLLDGIAKGSEVAF